MAKDKKAAYTREEYQKFKRLVELSESRNQMDRIASRMDFPKFIEKVGKDKCDLMFEELKKEPM